MSLIEEDVRNNSAWNYLNFVVERRDLKIGTKEEASITKERHVEVRDREVGRSLEHMKCAPGNESAHNYLIGNLVLQSEHAKDVFTKSAPFAVQSLLQLNNDNTCWVKSSLVDIYAAAEEHKCSPSDLPDSGEGEPRPYRDRVVELCTALSKIDPVRSKYWQHIKG
eukprot:TRINITY_DN6597_c0_g1_i2.p2 TRINITY_DN6597_c0_g1~~TRINITY_DN6597_c0_g1_i2.p2  ORF type:complete len:166 (+),score=23.54 TRINITY_DN6597_c0_g1_i2:564-1061(+)